MIDRIDKLFILSAYLLLSFCTTYTMEQNNAHYFGFAIINENDSIIKQRQLYADYASHAAVAYSPFENSMVSIDPWMEIASFYDHTHKKALHWDLKGQDKKPIDNFIQALKNISLFITHQHLIQEISSQEAQQRQQLYKQNLFASHPHNNNRLPVIQTSYYWHRPELGIVVIHDLFDQRKICYDVSRLQTASERR